VIRTLLGVSAAGALLVAGCDRAPPPAPHGNVAAKTIQTGTASYYGKEFAGRKTASGERLKLDDMTAASRTLPLGSHVEVVNLDTGQAAKVRINDRGPYAHGRVLDLTPKAARHIGIDKRDGLAEVAIRTSPGTEADVADRAIDGP
jgi:rare lipoprotein A